MLNKIAYTKNLCCFIAGAILPLAFSPIDYKYCALVSIAIAFLCLYEQPVRHAWINGIFYGVGMFGVGVSWVYVSIHDYGNTDFLLAGMLTLCFVLFLTILFVVPIFWCFAKITYTVKPASTNQQTDYYQKAVLFTAVWVLFEWVRSWLLTGFPWLLLGYSCLDTDLAVFAPLVGVYGLSFILVLLVTLICSLIISKGKEIISWLLLAAISIILLSTYMLLKNKQWTKISDNVEFAAIQGNIPQTIKWDPQFINSNINKYQQLTIQALDKELIIWPENAIPVLLDKTAYTFNFLTNLAKNHGVSIITGIPINDTGKIYNSVLLLGASTGRYDKVKLVPFGEYVPLESMLRGIIKFFDLPMSGFSAGAGVQSLLKTETATISPSVCYEIVYPDFIAKNAKDSNFLINLTNDTWFGASIGPMQHLQIARMRALETNRWLIRVTNSGITALIDANGTIQQTLPMFQSEILTGIVPKVVGNTPFILYQSWPVIILCILIIICCLIRRKRSKMATKHI